MSEAKPETTTTNAAPVTDADLLSKLPETLAEAVELFASQSGTSVPDVVAGFKAMYGEVTTEAEAKAAVAALADEKIGTSEAFKATFPKIPGVRFAAALNAFRTAFAAKATATDGDSAGPGKSSRTILPPVPGGDILTNAFRAGGISHVEEAHVVALVRSFVASEAGIFTVLGTINSKVSYRLRNELKRPAPPTVCALRKEMRERKRSELLSYLEDQAGSPASDDDCRELLNNARTVLLPGIVVFYDKITEWRKNLLLNAAAVPGYYPGAPMPNSRLAKLASMADAQKIDTKSLRRAADEFIGVVNATFADLGVLAAVTLMERAKTYTELLDNAELRSLLQVADETEMIAKLGLKKHESDKDDESLLAQLAIAMMGFKNTAIGSDAELEYILAMIEVGDAVSWPRWGQVVANPVNTSRNGNGRSNNQPFSANRSF